MMVLFGHFTYSRTSHSAPVQSDSFGLWHPETKSFEADGHVLPSGQH
jgi:hypothetical protein